MSTVDKNENYSKKTDKEIKDDISNKAEDVKEGAEDIKDKVKAGFKAVGEKVIDPKRDLKTEYNKEKMKEKTD
jgi:hypothetical protein